MTMRKMIRTVLLAAGFCSCSLVPAAEWSAPITVIENHGRLAIGNQVHVVGHSGANLVHRRSADGGATWSAPTVIGPAASNYPMMYGGLFCLGDTLYLLTADGDMGGGPKPLYFWKSTDNGATWSTRVRVTASSGVDNTFRARIVASGPYVHVGGQGDPANGCLWYFRSVNGGTNWEAGRKLAANLGGYGGGQTVAVDGDTVHLVYNFATNGVGAGPTYYLRSTNSGTAWSQPVSIGENTAESFRQARVQLAAVDGRVLAVWQREATNTGSVFPPDRLGYNRSEDGGATWGPARILPEDTGVDRNHHEIWMTSGGKAHIAWRQGNTKADPCGYMSSPDYGQTWSKSQIALDTDEVNHPYSIVANQTTVHVLTGPLGALKYAYGRLAYVTTTNVVRVGEAVTLAWQSNQTSVVFTVQTKEDLSAGDWSSVAPTSQWPRAGTVWTNTGPTRNREYFRVQTEER